MSYEEFIWRLQMIPAIDIFERQELLHEYCYSNDIDIGITFSHR